MIKKPLYFAGIRIDRYDLQGSLAAVRQHMKKGVRVYFVNAHCINTAQESASYREALNRAECVFNDGAGMALAGSLLGSPFPANLNGTDWIPAFLDTLDAQGGECKVFLLGDTKEAVQNTCEVFSRRWPSLQVVGTHHGYYRHALEAVEAIWDASPDLLLVGMGVPKQELFIDEHWESLKDAGVKIAIGGGAIFKFLTGEAPRAPGWLRKCRLEWVWRLVLEPKRLWRRYLLGNFKFLRLVLQSKRKKARKRA